MNSKLPLNGSYSNAYLHFVLLLLTGMYAINYADRYLIFILTIPIQKEFHLSYTQVGLLTGTSFAIFYSVFAIPIAKFADHSNRRNIIALSMLLWSIFTILSGVATTFSFLLAMRICVAIGEAGGSTPASAMLSDFYPVKKRGGVLSIFTSGIFIGATIALLSGGWLTQYFGWRTAFLVVGSPGIIYALILFLTVKEPAKGYSEGVKSEAVQNVTFLEGWKILKEKKTFLFLSFAASLSAFVAFGMNTFLPKFFSGIYRMKIGEIGSLISLKTIAGAIVCFGCGFITDKLARRDKRWYLWVPAVTTILSIPFYLLLLIGHHDILVLLVGCFFSSFFLQTFIGSAFAVTHLMVPSQMRSFSTAILLFFINVIGQGLGPVIVGWASDILSIRFGNDSIRLALSLSMIFLIVASFLYYKASERLREDLLLVNKVNPKQEIVSGVLSEE
jgi:MFS family permease